MAGRLRSNLVAAAMGLVCFGCPETQRPSWYFTCGDPVCRGYQRPTGVPACTQEKAGATCDASGARCDPVDDCNRLLLCSLSDPKLQGCPISSRTYKRDIRYLSEVELDGFARQIRAMRLATYRYNEPSSPRHLGFIIEDQPVSAAVDRDRDMVELYGYLSMAVATLQVQAREIERLEREMTALRRDVRRGAP